MPRVRVTDSIGDLAADMTRVAVNARADMKKVVGKQAQRGARVAASNARRTAGSHGKHYPASITSNLWDARIAAEYGPDPSLPQGGMSFELGSRNQPPHLDMARSFDAIKVSFPEAVSQQIDRWFW